MKVGRQRNRYRHYPVTSRLVRDGRSHALNNPEMEDRGAKGFSDEAIVVIKREANEDTVMYLRVKLHESDKEIEAKGGTC